ncbi:hypothetical protein [Halocatena marina]|uniref:Uncharacterized protein n=1 Tax=Halocatena marina TaxID=2934937 RepID=A0ABD5YYH1_9EURY|nr:hypothetical protein [Halocatena marina]
MIVAGNASGYGACTRGLTPEAVAEVRSQLPTTSVDIEGIIAHSQSS